MTDLIKLNEKGIRAYKSTGGAPHRAKLDWQNRTGKVVKYSRDRSIAYVIWDGRRTSDLVSVKIIEPR
jgi:hypothetical protein